MCKLVYFIPNCYIVGSSPEKVIGSQILFEACRLFKWTRFHGTGKTGNLDAHFFQRGGGDLSQDIKKYFFTLEIYLQHRKTLNF